VSREAVKTIISSFCSWGCRWRYIGVFLLGVNARDLCCSRTIRPWLKQTGPTSSCSWKTPQNAEHRDLELLFFASTPCPSLRVTPHQLVTISIGHCTRPVTCIHVSMHSAASLSSCRLLRPVNLSTSASPSQLSQGSFVQAVFIYCASHTMGVTCPHRPKVDRPLPVRG